MSIGFLGQGPDTEAVARKTKEDTLKTVSTILDAAEIVFITHGVAKATIAQIAEGAGVSKGAVYGHFKDKIEVCVAVCERGLGELRDVTRVEKGESYLEMLYRWGREYMRLFQDSASYRNVGEILYVKCEKSPEFERIQNIRLLWERRAFNATGRLIRKAISVGELPAGTDPVLGNVYLHSIIDGLICTCFYTERIVGGNTMEVVEGVLKMGIKGLATQDDAAR